MVIDYYYQCEDCDSTYTENPMICSFCSGNNISTIDFPNYQEIDSMDYSQPPYDGG